MATDALPAAAEQPEGTAVDIVVRGRHTDIADRFRQHVHDKLAKVGRLDPKVFRIDVEVSREHNPRQSDICERVELTCRSRGPVIRSEAVADDRYGALDLAFGRLEARLRKAADRRRVHHGARTPVSVATALAGVAAAERGAGPDAAAVQDAGAEPEDGTDRPLVVREKLHSAAPMTLDQALFEMELVGHDFFLFADAGTGRASVVYRRQGYAYGVIRLDPAP